MNRRNYIPKLRTWAFIKDKVDSGGLTIDYIQRKNKIRVFVTEGDTKFFINLFSPSHRRVRGQSPTNAADYQDFVDNYQNAIDDVPPSTTEPVVLANIATEGNKLTIHESSRPLKDGKAFATVWTGCGDDITNHILGGGDTMSIEFAVDEAEKSVIAEFDPIFGETWLHEGYVMWQNAGWGDNVSNSVWAKATALQTLVDLHYEMDGNKIKIATGGPSTGTHGFAATPVLIPNDEILGHWDYDGTLTPNLTQTGAYDMYDIDVEVERFHNKIPLFGTASSFNMLQSADSAKVPNNYYVKITARNVSNTAWNVWFIMTLYRERTV